MPRAAVAFPDTAPARVFDVAKAAPAVVHQRQELVVCRYDTDRQTTDVQRRDGAMRGLGVDADAVRERFRELVAWPAVQRG